MESYINIRPLHLICLLTFVKADHPSALEKHMAFLTQALNRGVPAQIVPGPDAFCQDSANDFLCPALSKKTCNHAITRWNDAIALQDLTHWVPPEKGWGYGNIILFSPPLVEKMRGAFTNSSIRRSCTRCHKRKACDAVVVSNYKETVFFSPQTERKNTALLPYFPPSSPHPF